MVYIVRYHYSLAIFKVIKGVFVLAGIQQILHLEESTVKRPCITVVYP